CGASSSSCRSSRRRASSATSRRGSRSPRGWFKMPAPNLTLVPAEPAAAPVSPDGRGDWEEAWRGAIALGWGSLAVLTALSDPRRFREWWLADLRQLTGDYLRSPAFLALAKFNLTFLARRTPPSAR